MLRPPRRHARSLIGIVAVLVSIGLMWPAGIAAGSGSSGPGPASTAAAARPDRAPTVRSLGVKSVDAGRGQGPSKPLQTLTIDRSFGGTSPNAGTPSDVTGGSSLVVATNSGAPAATSFAAVEGLDQNTDGSEPANPWVAVGPDDVVQTVNKSLRFTNREGTSTAGTIDMFEFFDLANFEVDEVAISIDGIDEPRWLYDAKHNRWLGQTMGWHCDTNGSTGGNNSVGYVFGAISLTGDPTGDYYHFFVQYISGIMPVSTALGTSGDKFTIAANEVTLNSTASCTSGGGAGTFDAASLTSFDWADMLTSPSDPIFGYDFFIASDGYRNLRPAVSPIGASNTIFIVGEHLPGLTTSNVTYMKLTGLNASPAGAVLSPPIDLTTTIGLDPFLDAPDPSDPGGGLADGIVGRQPTDAIWQDNVLTFPSTTDCPGQTRPCARVTQLNTSPATPTLVQDFVIQVAGAGTWYPGVGISQSGILHVVYSQSNATEGMSSYDRYQLPADPVNSLSAARLIATGGVLAYGGDRWGEYVGVAQDPRDTNAVWQANQYTKAATAGGTWGTRVSQLQTAGSTFHPIAPVRVLSSRDGVGLSGKFNANVARTITIGNGVPADAVAITGNLTVTEQNAAGFLAVTPTPNNTPSTSSMNFPLGDNRANNIISPLSTTGSVSIVYKAIAGRSTHVILDVTGYFSDDPADSTYNALAVPGRSLDSRDGTGGLTGKFVHGVVRGWKVRGSNNIPDVAGVTAVTGNLTVTGQSTRGFAAIGPSVLSNPATSTLNIPLGDTRANGITVGLSATGRLEAVFRGTTSAASAHLIFDVTGYYRNDTTGARFVPLTPGRRMDTRSPAPREGLTGAFSANVARTLVIEPYQGVPGNATAIAGNLTVVGQNHAGFVAMTPTADNNPDISTLNFPLNDIRANGVVGPLSGAGSVGLVFKTTTGTTHLILDITGYFR